MITQEERNNLRQVVEYSKSGVVKVIPLPWQTVEILLNALKAAEDEAERLRDELAPHRRVHTIMQAARRAMEQKK